MEASWALMRDGPLTLPSSGVRRAQLAGMVICLERNGMEIGNVPRTQLVKCETCM